jgi:hypothetical protein
MTLFDTLKPHPSTFAKLWASQLINHLWNFSLSLWHLNGYVDDVTLLESIDKEKEKIRWEIIGLQDKYTINLFLIPRAQSHFSKRKH